MALVDVKHILWSTIKDELASRNIDVKVTREYPKTVHELDNKPMISIARVSGAEEIMMVSDLIGGAIVEDNSYLQSFGYLNQEIFEISIWATSSEIRDDLLILVRQLLFEKRLYFASHGFQKMILVGATDEEVDLAKLPRVIYRGVLRYLIMSQVKKQTVDELVAQIVPSLLIQQQTNI